MFTPHFEQWFAVNSYSFIAYDFPIFCTMGIIVISIIILILLNKKLHKNGLIKILFAIIWGVGATVLVAIIGLNLWAKFVWDLPANTYQTNHFYNEKFSKVELTYIRAKPSSTDSSSYSYFFKVRKNQKIIFNQNQIEYVFPSFTKNIPSKFNRHTKYLFRYSYLQLKPNYRVEPNFPKTTQYCLKNFTKSKNLIDDKNEYKVINNDNQKSTVTLKQLTEE